MMKLALIFVTTVPLIGAVCFGGFNQTDQGCFKAVNTRKTWSDAEAACQKYGSFVHLATLDTQQVGTLVYRTMCCNYILDMCR